jgi:GNAT superfamily N-acetyltransferase
VKVDGFRVARLTVDDASDLQDLFERTTDFFELCEGGAALPDAALKELTHVPEGFSNSDLVAFGFRRERLDGVVVLLREPRKEASWWIGLLLLDPAVRNNGSGTRIFEATREWLAASGTRTIYIGVVVNNTAARRFWIARGFEELDVQPYTTSHGITKEVVVMRRTVE